MPAPKKPNETLLNNNIQKTFSNAMPNLNMVNGNALVNAVLKSIAGVSFSVQTIQNDSYNDMFIGSSGMDALYKKGDDMEIAPIAAKKSGGNLIFPSVNGITTIPNNTSFLVAGLGFTSTVETSLQNLIATVLSVTYDSVANITIITTTNSNNIIKDLVLTIEGTSNTIAVLGVNSDIEFAVSGDVTATVTASTNLTYSIFQINVTSNDTGTAQNIIGYAPATSSYLPNITGYVDSNGLIGGLDDESEDAYRNRLLSSNSTLNKAGVLNDTGFDRLLLDNQLSYQYKLLEANNELVVTPGFMTIYLLKNDNTLLAQSELNQITNLIFDKQNGVAPPTIRKEDDRIKILNASLKVQDFAFSNLQPDFLSLRVAIINSLTDLFLNEVQIGNKVTFYQYNSAIRRSVDNVGNKIDDITITNFSGDITAALNERIILGSVTFA